MNNKKIIEIAKSIAKHNYTYEHLTREERQIIHDYIQREMEKKWEERNEQRTGDI